MKVWKARSCMVVVVVAAASAPLAALSVACGDSYRAEELAPRLDAGGTEPATSDAASELADAASEAAAPVDFDVACRDLGARLCELRKPCCEKTTGFDGAACLSNAVAECKAQAAEVARGVVAYHPERIDTCEPLLREVYTRCEFSLAAIVPLAKSGAACRVFEGSKKTGEPCLQDSDCALGGPSTFTSCAESGNDAGKACTTIPIVSSGGPCTFTTPAADLCDEALFCDADFSKTPAAGTCKLAAQLGGSCTIGGPAFQCGVGNYCDSQTALCVKGKGGGASCASTTECASFTCTAGDGGSTCAPPTGVLSASECK